MKKMLFAAIVACAAGVYADCGTPETVSTPYVYEFKASLKTVEAKSTAVTGACAATCYRVKGSRTLKGLIIGCDECTDFYEEGVSDFWLTTSASRNTIVSSGTYTANAIFFGAPTAAKSTSAEVIFTVSGVDYYTSGIEREIELEGMGYGAQKNGILQTASGNMIGTYSAAMCTTGTACTTGEEEEAIAFTPCDLEEVDADTGDIAFGTWAIKYNAGLSKKAAVDSSAVRASYFGSKAVYQDDLVD